MNTGPASRLRRIDMIRRRQERRERASGQGRTSNDRSDNAAIAAREERRLLQDTEEFVDGLLRQVRVGRRRSPRAVGRSCSGRRPRPVRLPTRTVDPGRPLGLSFEAYHLGFDESDRTRYTIEYTAYRKTDRFPHSGYDECAGYPRPPDRFCPELLCTTGLKNDIVTIALDFCLSRTDISQVLLRHCDDVTRRSSFAVWRRRIPPALADDGKVGVPLEEVLSRNCGRGSCPTAATCAVKAVTAPSPVR